MYLSDLNNYDDVIKAPTDNSDNINKYQIAVDNEEMIIELEANVVPPNGNNVSSEYKINNHNCNNVYHNNIYNMCVEINITYILCMAYINNMLSPSHIEETTRCS